MQHGFFFTQDAEVTPENLGQAIQQAIEIEIATIPVYLYTYYSINRSPDQDTISGMLAQELVKTGLSLKDATATALDLSAAIMVYANKAGALIMSVAIEEMLHMALSSNLKQALAGPPDLVGKSPSVWPACLPGHEPPCYIDRAKFSLPQLLTFLKIESPHPLPDARLLKAPIPYKTIGQFYKMIIDCINNNELYYNPRASQLAPGRNFYTSNTIDTVFYDKKHQPKFTNADNSGDLIVVKDRQSALDAITIIIDQGEGNEGAQGFGPDMTVDCSKIIPEDYDNPTRTELCHFEKFAQIYCQYKDIQSQFDELGIGPIDISQFFVVNFPVNPSTAHYPKQIAAVSDLINGVYTYLFVMVENCYQQTGNTQYETFMFGVHKSMIFILNSLCGDIQGLTYKDQEGNLLTAAPTFEDYPFGLVSSPKSQLIDLYNIAVQAYPTISYLQQRILDLPDVPLQVEGIF